MALVIDIVLEAGGAPLQKHFDLLPIHTHKLIIVLRKWRWAYMHIIIIRLHVYSCHCLLIVKCQ